MEKKSGWLKITESMLVIMLDSFTWEYSIQIQ